MKQLKQILLTAGLGLVLSAAAQNHIRINASFYSPVLDMVKPITVFLPADYYINTHQHYATIYYLHGGGGNHQSGVTDALWYYNQHALDTTITSPPAIFICPNGACEPFMGSMWMNSELYGRYEDYFVNDVIAFVESNFRAVPHKNFRNLVGWSMGGWGTARFCTNHPDKFRAGVPCIGFFAAPDTTLNTWRQLCFDENGSFNLHYDAGANTRLLFTMTGGLSPNLSATPYPVDLPFDTLGNWIDSVVAKWRSQTPTHKVRFLPDENELSWFLICGTQDYMVTYPTYQIFMDSLDHYGIQYRSNYFDGGHVWHPESWIMAIHWLDSIINLSFKSLGISHFEGEESVMQAFPNPADHFLQIRFRMETSGQIDISLTDMAGCRVASVFSGHLPDGWHEFRWERVRLPAGIYVLNAKTLKQQYPIRIILR